MRIKIDKEQARKIVRAAAMSAKSGQVDQSWFERIEKLSKLCDAGVSKTHIAFLGTAFTAKAVETDVDLFAIKPNHAPENPRAFSARTLCHSVLVPLSADLAFDLGVTGREPLNNQPYFRMTRLDDGTPVHQGAQVAFNYMLELVTELDKVTDVDEARGALAAFIAERRRHQITYGVGIDVSNATVNGLKDAIVRFVRENSESGRRAQAVVAGLLDVFAGPERVVSGRINDPSRRYPGDVCVASSENLNAWDKAFEVRDKPVLLADVQIFGKKCLAMGVREAAVVAVAPTQKPLDNRRIAEWSCGLGLGVILIMDWHTIVDQALFWAADASPNGASKAAMFIRERLTAVEVKVETIRLWDKLIQESRSTGEEQRGS